MPGIVIVGAGPGIGAAVARRFARDGFDVFAVARSADGLAAVRRSVSGFGIAVVTRQADVSNEVAIREAIDGIVQEAGVPDVLVYNAARIRYDSIGELSHEAHLEAWSVNVLGAVTVGAAALPAMAQRGRGTFILTGGMPQALPNVVSLSLGKAGVRALTDLLAAEYGPKGIHVATVTVCGPVAPGSEFDPDTIADEYWNLHVQIPSEWTRRVDFTGTQPTSVGTPVA